MGQCQKEYCWPYSAPQHADVGVCFSSLFRGKRGILCYQPQQRMNASLLTYIQNDKTLRLYKPYTHHMLICFICMIRMFCNLIRTCSSSSLITKIDWIKFDIRRSMKEVSDKKHSIFSRIQMFWNNHDTSALHNSVWQDGVLFSLFSFFHNIKMTRESLLEKNMDITKYLKKSNDKLDDRVLNFFVPCSSTSSVLLAARQMNSVPEE